MIKTDFRASASEARPRLLVLPTLKIPTTPPKLTRKLRTGLDAYAARWPGSVHVCIEPSDAVSNDLDHEAFDPESAKFTLEIADFSDPKVLEQVAQADLVLGALSVQQNHIAAFCRANDISFVPIAEYTLKTRLQIVRTKGKELLRRWRRYVWEAGQESANRDALGLSAGVQCNGMPTYEAYCERTPDPLLFFDSRVTEDMLVDPQEQRAREKRLMAGGPLHLTYAGRLIEMKGPLHLLKVAHHLEKLQVPFHLSIAGGGDLEEELRRRIEAERLTGSVQMVGTLDFNRELMPMLRHSADLALFCHPQGDPSCAYLEAMAAGLPVVGYANEALASMCKLTSAGWSTPLNEPRALAERIAELHGDRLSLVRAGRAASDFAADNTFERTMDRRVDHLKAILASRAPQPVD